MKLNRTTLRTVDILKMVSKKPDGITLDEICEKLELPKTRYRYGPCGKGAEAALYHRTYCLSCRN